MSFFILISYFRMLGRRRQDKYFFFWDFQRYLKNDDKYETCLYKWPSG